MIAHEDLTPEQRALMPNLFVVGASKCGTSSLHAYLGSHPQIVGAAPKEPCFFVDQDELMSMWPNMGRNPVSHDLSAYLGMFRARKEAAYRLESSVYYSQRPHFTGVPERIARASPEARIIYVVRDPVARTVSHYWQRLRELQEDRPIDEAIVSGSIYADTSDYVMQLDAYLAHFREVKVLAAEDLRHRRGEVLADLFEWLGLEPLPMTGILREERHRTGELTRVPRFGFVRAARDSAAWQTARALLPQPVVRMAGQLAVRRVPRAAFDETAVRARLREHFRPLGPALDERVGRPVSAGWVSVR